MAYQTVFWIDTALFQGKLGIMPRPRGDAWLPDELLLLKQQGVDTIVSLLIDQEILELQLRDEAAACQRCNLTFVSFPIADRATPPWGAATWTLLQRLGDELCAGKKIVIHCRMGIGRSATIAAALLTRAGLRVDQAFEAITHARGRSVPDTAEQRRWVERFGEAYQTGFLEAASQF